ncbi:CRISPR-associated endonuclease Cas2 [Olsenella sp. An290]|nr:CRISPR-associated endonuclease Cas2 [Olsenella sp. An290]
MGSLERNELNLGAIGGASPAETRYYFIALFDISDKKKYRILLKLLKRYGTRIQKSVFEGRATNTQLRELNCEIARLMDSDRFFNPDDRIRLYRIAGNCSVTVYGDYNGELLEENVFI